MPKISVITPCYNASASLAKTIESVLAQTMTDYEMVLLDDGSTDDTAEIIASYHDPRLRYVYQENAGPSAARNHAVALARGEYIAFLDSDDIALPHRLASQAALLDAHPEITVVGSGYTWIDENDQPIHWRHSWESRPDIGELRTWLFDCPFVPSATMLRRAAYEEAGGFDRDLHGGEDWNFWMRLYLGGHRMMWHQGADRVVCLYRVRRDSLSNDAGIMSRDCPEALSRVLLDPRFPPELLPDGQKALALRHVDGAKRLYSSQEWERGRLVLETAIRLDPSLVAGTPCRIEDELISAALGPMVLNEQQFLVETFKHLPSNAYPLLGRHDHMRFRCHVELLAQGLQQRDSVLVRQHLLPVLISQPQRLFDRATWALALRALANRVPRILRKRGR